MTEVVLIYLLIVNAIGFLLMTVDKYKAKKNLWRIPESTLMKNESSSSTTPSSRHAEEVMILNVDPGSYVSLIQLLRHI